jgi:hypothetical protein
MTHKDIYIKDEGDFVTVIAMTDKAKEVFKRQKVEGIKFDIELSDAHLVLALAVSHDLQVDSEVSIIVPSKNVSLN